MEILFAEMINEILLKLDRPSLFYAAQVNRQWRQLCLKQTVPIYDEEALKYVCTNGDRLSLVRSVFNRDWARGGFICACYRGHRVIVELLIRKGANFWNTGFICACLGGHRDLVNMMMEKGGISPYEGLFYACREGHRELVEFLIQRRATQWLWRLFCSYQEDDCWDEGLYGACRGGHRDLVDLTIQNGADDWNMGLSGACEGGHPDLVGSMIEKGATRCDCGRPINQH